MTPITTQTDNTLLLHQDVPNRTGVWAICSDLAELSKLRITAMVVATTYVGFQLGSASSEHSGNSWGRLVAILVGTALSCIAASVFNQVLERDVDAKMNRTRLRPLPTGRMSLATALAFGLITALGGLVSLQLFANSLAAAFSAFTIFSYTFIYTPMKRTSGLATIVGAVPGALPPVIGYAAATGTVAGPALAVFAIMFMWQLPHFLAIAWLYRDDYARAQMPMLPVLDPTGASTFRQMLLECIVLLPVGLIPALTGISGMIYFTGAMIAGVVFLGFALALVLEPSARYARAMFFASLVYLPVVLLLLMIDRV